MRYVSIGLGLVLIIIGVAILFQAPGTPIEPTRQGDAPVSNSVAEYSGKLVANRVLGGVFLAAGVLAFCLGGLGCDICEEVASKQRAAQQEKQRQGDLDDDAALLRALDALDPDGEAGASYNQVQTEARLSDARMQRAVSRLKREKIVKEVTITATVGCGGKRQVRGLRRVADE
jgi:hypothetical protein